MPLYGARGLPTSNRGAANIDVYSLQNCRKFSGCVAANNLVLDKKNVQVEDPNGVIKVYNDSNTGSDGIARRSFCSNCGR